MSELPAGWSHVSIDELITLNPKNNCHETMKVGFVPMPLMGSSYLEDHRFEERLWADVKKGYTHFADGDVLLAKITPCFENGKAGIAKNLPNGVGAGSTEYFVCRVHPEKLFPKYLLAFFKTVPFMKSGEVNMTGSVGHKRVPKNYLLSTRIPLAPLSEQKRITDKLDTLLARVDATRERLDRIPVILKRFRQSVLAAATSGRLTEEWREENKVCEGWIETSIGESGFVTKLAGFEYTKLVKYRDDGDLRVLKAENAGRLGFKFTEFSKVRSDEVSMLTRSRIYAGDLLMVFVGAGTGQVARVPYGDDWFLGPNVAMIRTNPAILNSSYLEHYCRSPQGWNELMSFTKAVAQPSLSMKAIRQVSVPLPSIEEQREIVRRVEVLFALADKLEARYTTARAQVDKLTPALLAKAFRGELIEQDPNDEPAPVLLERIKAERKIARQQPSAKKKAIKKVR